MDSLAELINDLGLWTWWVVAGILFLLELMAPGIFFLWLGTSAVIVAIAVQFFDISWQLQVAAFGVLSVVILVVSRRFFSPSSISTDQPKLNKRVLQYVGKTFVLDEAIVNGRGSLRVADSQWPITGPDAGAGTRVEVTGAEGATLTVTLVGEESA